MNQNIYNLPYYPCDLWIVNLCAKGLALLESEDRVYLTANLGNKEGFLYYPWIDSAHLYE